MKRNNQNFIFDSDITITQGANLGKSLDRVLSSQESRIAAVESNTKWLYKYGGMGSGGSSSGSSSTTSWRAVLTCVDTGGTILKDGDTINFSSTGDYSFKLQIYNGGSSEYKLTWTYKNQAGNQTVTDKITSSDSFSITKKFTFDMNSNLNLTILDTSTLDVATYSVKYIVVPYDFSIYFVYADNHQVFYPYSNGNIFMSMVKTRGLQVALDYEANVDLTTAKYTYVDWDGNSHTIDADDEDLEDNQEPIKSNHTGVIYLDLVAGDIIEYLSTNSNAAYREFTLDLQIRLQGRSSDETISTLKLENNLIPADMYLKVQTSAGSIYLSKPDSYQKLFSIGTAVFNVTPYFGSADTSRVYAFDVKYGTSLDDAVKIDKSVINVDQLIDQTDQSVSIPITDSGEHYIVFTIKYSGTSYSCGYYMSVKALADEFPWYPNDTDLKVVPDLSAFYRKNVDVNGIYENGSLLSKTASLDMTVNNSTRTLTIDADTDVDIDPDKEDQLISFGIQYSAINDTDDPILSFNTSAGKGSIYIYQDKVLKTNNDLTIAGTSKDIFIDKVQQLDKSDNDSFHLISIYKRHESSSGNDIFKSISIYVDGILEAVFDSFDNQHTDFTSIKLYPGNYYINLLEYSCFNHISTSGSSTSRTYLLDNDVLEYYYSYAEKILDKKISQIDQIIYEQFSQFTADEENFIECTDTQIETIAEKASVPVLVITYTDTDAKINTIFSGYNKDNFRSWMNKSYGENDNIETVNVTVKWSSGNGESLHNIQYDNENAIFQTTIQGSSTRGYRCKNFELMAPASTSTKDFIFTPNFSSSDTSTFLPESSFTLKADVVDSSHSNNNAMGEFINTITTKFKNAKQTSSSFSGHIKNCLTGFPVLLFLHTNYKESETSGLNKNKYYFLGIYNFNLGRKSYFNLGYKDLSLLSDIGLQNNNGFTIYSIDSETNALLTGMRVAEVQGNSSYFDFSQADSSILFALPGFSNDSSYMFGDIVDGRSSSGTNTKDALLTMTKAVSLAGGHIFSTIGKSFSYSSEDNYGYTDGYSATDSAGVSKNQVPNYRYIAVRTKSGTDDVYTFALDTKTASEASVKDLVIGDQETNVSPIIDYVSLAEYYTVCMAFGLVDSVQKNLNVKSWNDGKTFYLAFYDMDTCLGIANDGSKINYYAFSDYWKSSNTDSNLNSVNVYRDFAPVSSSDNHSLYDIPSSYLFAVAKYAHLILTDQETLEMTPNNIWGKWRCLASTGSDIQTGCLQDADTFINKYYKNHLNNVPLAAFNVNYRYKYLVPTTAGTSYDSTNFPKFWGRKIAYTRNWLNNRFHILDAYFNLNCISDALTSVLQAPVADSDYIDDNNSDIYVLHDIFSSSAQGTQYSSLNRTVQIQALPSSPIILKIPSGTCSRYLTPEDYGQYQIQLKTTGNQFLLIGGSSLWTYINTIEPFINSSHILQVTSDYFTSLYGSSGQCSQWVLDVPSIRDVALTGSDYSGQLSFNSGNPNLQTVNINNTAIELTITGSTLNTIKATNMQAGSKVIVTNTYTLTTVELNGEFTTISIPAWKKNIYLPTDYQSNAKSILNCQSITIVNDTEKYPDNALYIRNNSTLTTLTVEGFATISISDCPNLTSVEIRDNDVLTSFSLTYSSDANSSITINSTTSNIVDFGSQTKLSSVYFNNCAFEEIIFGNSCNIVLNGSSFSGCTGLKYVTTNGSSKVILNGTYVFNQCRSYALKTRSGTWTNMVLSSTIKDISGMFYIGDSFTGSITLSDAMHFMNVCCNEYRDNITALNNLFCRQSINYSLNSSEYVNHTCSLDFNFKNATSATNALYGTGVTFFNRYMVKNLGSNVDSLDIGNFITPGQTGVLYMTEDSFYEILPKLSSLYIGSYWLSFYDIYRNEETNEIECDLKDELVLRNIFNGLYDSSSSVEVHPIKLTYVDGININTSTTVDLTDAFDEEWVAANVSGLTIYDVASNKTMTIKEGTLDTVFNKIKIKSIGRCFKYVVYVDEKGKNISVNLRNFIDWDRLEDLTNLFYDSYEGYTSLNFTKHFETLTDFQYVWDKIIGASKLTAISYLCQNLEIRDEGFDEEEPFYLNSEVFRSDSQNSPNTSIENINYLFDGMYVTVDSGTTKSYLSLNHSFLKYMPNITSAKCAFRGLYLYHTLPYDFFNKRYEKTTTVQVDKYSTDPISDEQIIVKVQGKKHEFAYNQHLTNLYQCFYNTHCKENFEGFDPEASYNENCITDNYLAYYLSATQEETKIDLDLPFSSYYYNTGSSTKRSLEHCTEITDCQISTDFTESFTIQSMTDTQGASAEMRNYPLNYKSYNANRLFVAPDIIYGIVNSASNIEQMFTNPTYTDSSNNTVYGVSNTFVGALPKHMFKSATGISFKYMLLNLNILPQQYAVRNTVEIISNEDINVTYRYYVFVPSGFTEATNLEHSFNFRIIMPQPSTNADHLYYSLFLNDSIPENVYSISNSLPSTGYYLLFQDKYGSSTYNFASHNHGLYYSLVDTMIYNDDGEFTGIKSGIDLNKFQNLKLDSLIGSSLIRLLSGHIFDQETWTGSGIPARMTTTTTHVIDLGSWGYFSAALSDQFPKNNNQFIVDGYTSGSPSINKQSVLNYDQITTSSYKGISFI